MHTIYKKYILLFTLLLSVYIANAQDPKLPGTNLGLNNFDAGKSGPPGWYYIQYLQLYHAPYKHDENGKLIEGSAVRSSLLSLNQLVFISNIKILKGNLTFNVQLPIIKTTETGATAESSNPKMLGNITAGAFLQWYDRQLFGMKLFYKIGFNASAPTGNYDDAYGINPGANMYRFFPHVEFTLTPFSHFSISTKQNLYVYFHEINSHDRVGNAYNLNYALQVILTKQFQIGIAGYYLDQLVEDSYDGDKNYYYNHYGISNTKEKVFGIGTGCIYTTPKSTSLELKAMWESGAVNRSQGFRATLVISFPL